MNHSCDSSESFPTEIAEDILLRLYTIMMQIRLVELRIEEEYPKNQIKTPIHLCIGQEATAAGICIHLTKDDYLFSNHRGHGHYLAKGGNLAAMIAELYCKKTGCAESRGGSMHLIDTDCGIMGSSSIVAGNIPIATGAALTSRLKQQGKISVVFFGDGASEEGVFFESMNFAALKKLPILFVCENNFYSVCSHQSARQANLNIAQRANAFGIKNLRIDASNVLTVYQHAQEIIASMRALNEPFLLECQAYRFRGHAGENDPLKDEYRNLMEWKTWMQKDPVENFEILLTQQNILTPEKKDSLIQTLRQQIDAAFVFAQTSPLPKSEELFDNLYHP